MVLDIGHGICMNNKIEELEAQLAEQKALVKALEASLEAEQEAGRQLREEYGTGLREAAERQREACAAILDGPDEVSANEVRKVKLVTDEPFD